MKTCAYCKRNEKLTREHVTPDFIYKLLKQDDGNHLAWNNNFNTYKRNTESVVKDVCAICNSENLSVLDSYGKNFVKTNKLHKSIYINNLIIKYDFELLSRWLLKIAYNSSRMSGGREYKFLSYIPYILNGGENQTPNNKYFSIILELLKPQIHNETTTGLVHDFKRRGKLYTNPISFSVTTYRSRKENNFEVSCIQIGGLRFHLLFISKELPIGHASIEKKKYMKSIYNSHLLLSFKNICNVKVTNRTWVDCASTSGTKARVDAYEG